jgi:hypothetical protein
VGNVLSKHDLWFDTGGEVLYWATRTALTAVFTAMLKAMNRHKIRG